MSDAIFIYLGVLAVTHPTYAHTHHMHTRPTYTHPVGPAAPSQHTRRHRVIYHSVHSSPQPQGIGPRQICGGGAQVRMIKCCIIVVCCVCYWFMVLALSCLQCMFLCVLLFCLCLHTFYWVLCVQFFLFLCVCVCLFFFNMYLCVCTLLYFMAVVVLFVIACFLY